MPGLRSLCFGGLSPPAFRRPTASCRLPRSMLQPRRSCNCLGASHRNFSSLHFWLLLRFLTFLLGSCPGSLRQTPLREKVLSPLPRCRLLLRNLFGLPQTGRVPTHVSLPGQAPCSSSTTQPSRRMPLMPLGPSLRAAPFSSRGPLRTTSSSLSSPSARQASRGSSVASGFPLGLSLTFGSLRRLDFNGRSCSTGCFS